MNKKPQSLCSDCFPYNEKNLRNALLHFPISYWIKYTCFKPLFWSQTFSLRQCSRRRKCNCHTNYTSFWGTMNKTSGPELTKIQDPVTRTKKKVLQTICTEVLYPFVNNHYKFLPVHWYTQNTSRTDGNGFCSCFQI